MTVSPAWARNHHVLAVLALVAATAVWGAGWAWVVRVAAGLAAHGLIHGWRKAA